MTNRFAISRKHANGYLLAGILWLFAGVRDLINPKFLSISPHPQPNPWLWLSLGFAIICIAVSSRRSDEKVVLTTPSEK
jgi:hypothetical protein